MKMSRYDPQMTGMAGEFLAVGKLFKKGLQASVTFGNAKAVDVFVYNPGTDKSYNVQVKTLRYKNCFPMKKESLKADHVYIFILLNDFESQEDFFVLTGQEILEDPDKFFGASALSKSRPSLLS